MASHCLWWTVQILARHSVSSVTQSCLTLCDPMDCSMPSFLELAQTHVYRVGDAIQPSHPLSSPSPPAFNLSQHQGLFQWVSSSHQVAKAQHQSSNEYSRLISFRMDWLDLLAVQGTLRSLLQHRSSKASILWRSALFVVQLSHPCMTNLDLELLVFETMGSTACAAAAAAPWLPGVQLLRPHGLQPTLHIYSGLLLSH